jgi:hypothetical protein
MNRVITDPAPSTATLPEAPRRRPGTRRMLGAGLAVLIGITALSACTGEAEPAPTPTETQAPESGITDITDAPGSGEGLVGALADTTVDTCELGDGEWNVDGTVTNSSDASASYRIYVSLLNEGGETRSLTQVDVPAIDAGAETEWSTTVALDEEDLSCVLRVERYGAYGEEPAPEGDGEG